MLGGVGENVIKVAQYGLLVAAECYKEYQETRTETTILLKWLECEEEVLKMCDTLRQL